MPKLDKKFFRTKKKAKKNILGAPGLFDVAPVPGFLLPKNDRPAILDNNRNNWTAKVANPVVDFSTEAVRAISAHQRFTGKIYSKCRESYIFRRQIKEFIKEQTGFEMPYNKKLWSKTQEQIEFRATYPDLVNLENFFYSLGISQFGVYAKFSQNGVNKFLNISNLYSKHRLCPVWNYRKSQIIRGAYFRFLNENDSIFENYRVLHLTLTVPHTPQYAGKDFYLSELLHDFNRLRKTEFFKKNVAGGEYGAEITAKNFEKNGLHIHLHSLLFCQKDVDLQGFKKEIQTFWHGRTGGTNVGLTDLYFYEKENGKYVYEHKKASSFINSFGEKINLPERMIKKKIYCTDSDKKFSQMDKEQRQKAYLSGILEAIKYHFKPGEFKNDDGTLKFGMLITVLNESKGNRFYSRFGFLKDVKELDFNNVSKDNDIPAADIVSCESSGLGIISAEKNNICEISENQQVDTDEFIKSSLKNLKIVNPFTGKFESSDTLKLHIANNSFIWYDKKTGISKSQSEFYKVKKDWRPEMVVQKFVKGLITDVLEPGEIERFRTYSFNFYE